MAEVAFITCDGGGNIAWALQDAGLAVCHAGHGTTLTALSLGVPLICIPGLGRDQEPIAARVAELRLGLALADHAPARAIHAAAATGPRRR